MNPDGSSLAFKNRLELFADMIRHVLPSDPRGVAADYLSPQVSPINRQLANFHPQTDNAKAWVGNELPMHFLCFHF